MQGDIDGLSTVERDRWKILVEERLEHYDLISGLKESGQDCIFTCDASDKT